MISMDLKYNEKVFLSNQFKILSLLYGIKGNESEAKNYELAAEGINFGLGDEAFMNIELPDDHDMDKKSKEYVFEVLEMYNKIYGVYQNKLSEKERESLDINDIKFIGFDGNSSQGLLYFCNYLMDDLNRFGRLGSFIKEHHWERNSHGDDDAKLKKMVEKYKSLKDTGDNFGLKEIEDILSV